MSRNRPSQRAIALLCASALGLAILIQPEPASAESEGAWWIPAVAASLLYTPAKLFVAATGAVMGSGAWLLLGGDDGAAEDIIIPAVRGDYWVEPDHLQGESHLDFMGR